MSTSPSLGQFIRQRRLELGLTQEQLAEQIGDSFRQSEVSRLEHDRVSLPRRERMEHLAAALEVTLGELLAHTGWLTGGADDLKDGDVDATIEAVDPGEPLTPADVRTLVEAVEAARSVIRTAMEALTMADEILRITSGTLDGAAGRGSIRPPIGVIRQWESSAIVA